MPFQYPYSMLLDIQRSMICLVDGLGDVGGTDTVAYLTDERSASTEGIRNHPTVYRGTHTPQGYENLETKRVMDLDNPVPTILAEVDFSKQEASGKYVCSICGYVYDPAEHDGVAFENLPDDWRCPPLQAAEGEIQQGVGYQ